MADFHNPSKAFICDYVVYKGRILETVLVPIPDGQKSPVKGGIPAEMREIFRQLDEILEANGATKQNVISVTLFLQQVNRDIPALNGVYKMYFGSHAPMRCAVGAELQAGMLVEAMFRVELPE